VGQKYKPLLVSQQIILKCINKASC